MTEISATDNLPVQAPEPAGTPGKDERARSLWSDAWYELRRSPMFWISSFLVLLLVLIAIAPQLFTGKDPDFGDLNLSRVPPGPGAIFGYDQLGRDVYARTIYGARASILVGMFTTVFTGVIGVFVGLISGFFGGWLDALLSRVGDIFFAIPLLLGGILFLFSFPNKLDTPYIVIILKVVLAITILGWPSIARLMRSSVLQVKPNDYVQAARALGASPARLIVNHIMPNAMAPVIVVSTINLGAYIGVEATLSYLGIGLQSPAISWGIAISDASGIGLLRAAPHMLLFPSLFLSVTVLAFILLGEAIRDALDPKLR